MGSTSNVTRADVDQNNRNVVVGEHLLRMLNPEDRKGQRAIPDSSMAKELKEPIAIPEKLKAAMHKAYYDVITCPATDDIDAFRAIKDHYEAAETRPIEIPKALETAIFKTFEHIRQNECITPAHAYKKTLEMYEADCSSHGSGLRK